MKRPLLFLLLVGFLVARWSMTAAESAASDVTRDDDLTSMAAFNVKADRLEDFGFRVSAHLGNLAGSADTFVVSVLPNTAAAKAGLRPGDRILKSDGKSASVTIFSLNKWTKLEAQKWAQVASGKPSVTWELEVQAPGATQTRVVKMVVPTPAPHWGASKWQPPFGRSPATVSEPGPLASRSREVLDNGVWSALGWQAARFMGTPWPHKPTDLFGFEWSIHRPDGRRKMFVTQQRGRTEVLLETSAKKSGVRLFLTSPTGALEKAWYCPPNGPHREISWEEARVGFQAEMDFWLTQVQRGAGRWPFEAIGPEIDVGRPLLTTPSGNTAGAGGSARQASLAPATEAQRALFAEAFAKIGADENRWAYTETSRGLDDKRVTEVRVDPAKPEGERCVLVKIDGKPPSAALLKRWRDEGREVPAALGELPPLASLVDLGDVRVWADETAAIVFELPVRSGDAELPAEKMQALFRVNKTQRACEDIAVKLREAVRVAGVAKVTEAGLTIRFQTLDPALAPQPVWLKAGGAARVFLVKFSRAFEATRTDFRRIAPAPANQSKP